MATNFANQFYMNNHIKQLKQSFSKDIIYPIEEQKQDFHTFLELQKLDNLTAELEKSLAEIKQLKAEMEDYKVKFNLDIRDNATKEIKKVLDNISKLGSK